MLYNLQNNYHNLGKYLHVDFMRIKLFETPAENICQYFDADLMEFCTNSKTKNSNYCDQHKHFFEDNLLTQSSKYFYLDETNYDFFDTEIMEAFQQSSFQILTNNSKYIKSLKILKLDADTNSDQIRQSFRSLAKKYHPDISKDDTNRFIEINNAYHFLKKIYSHFELANQ